MSDFFSKLKKGIDKGTKVISTKSTSVIETNKVKSELNAIKKSKADAFTAIGKKVYEAVDTGSFDASLINDEIVALKEYDALILEKEAELETIKTETEEKLNKINEDARMNEVIQDVEDYTDDVVEEVEDAVETIIKDIKDVSDNNL